MKKPITKPKATRTIKAHSNESFGIKREAKKAAQKPVRITQADRDAVASPPLTDSELASMRPAHEVLPAAFLKALDEGRVGRPKSAKPKKPIALRLDADIVDHLRTIEGYGPRIESLLRNAITQGKL